MTAGLANRSPYRRATACGAAPGGCAGWSRWRGRSRGPLVRGVRPGGPASEELSGSRAGKLMMLFEPMARPGGRTSSAHGGSSGFSLSSPLWTESLSRAQFQSMKLGHQTFLPSCDSLLSIVLRDYSLKMESKLLCEPQSNLQMVVLVFSYCVAGDGPAIE